MAGAADIDWLAYSDEDSDEEVPDSNLMKLRIHHWYLLVCHSLQKSNAKTTYTPLIVPSITRKRQMGMEMEKESEKELDRETEHKLLCSIKEISSGTVFKDSRELCYKAFSSFASLISSCALL